MENQLLKKQS